MNFSCINVALAGIFLVCALPVFAQTKDFNPYAAVFESEEGETATPYIKSANALYTLLTDPDACPIGSMQARRVPCALVADGELRPVFKIEGPERIWTLVRGELALVSVEDLWHVRKFDVPFDPYNPQRTSDVLGYAQNKKNCATSGTHCVPEARFTLFSGGRILTANCVTLIWDGEPARYKFLEPE